MWFRLLWVTWLHYSVSTLSENGELNFNSEDDLTLKLLTINGRLASLQDIYGLHPMPTEVSDFGLRLMTTLINSGDTEISSKLPDINTMSIDQEYIDREFIAKWSDQSISTPSDIVQRLLYEKDSSTESPLTILMGDVSTGKSVALGKLANQIDVILEYAWIIRVNVAEGFPASESTRQLTFDNIIQKFVKPSHIELFKSVLRFNPSRIFIFLDDVDKFVATHTDEIIATIQKMIASGATIVVATNPISVESLRLKFNPIVYELRELSIFATKSFLNSFWRTKIDGIIDEGTLSSVDLGVLKQRLQHYVDQFTHVLFKTNLPRFPVSLKVLAEVFAQQDSPLIIRRPEQYTFACIDYVLQRGTLPRYLDTVLERVHLDKYLLFEEIIKQSCAKSLQFYKYYGVIAITDIVRTLDPHQAAHFLELYERSFPIAQSTIRGQAEEPAFMKLSGDTLEFIDKRYQWFFAAKYLLDNLDESSVVPDAFFHAILKGPKYHELLAYLNRDSIKIPSSPFINAAYRTRNKIIKNLVDNGLEEILLQNMNHLLAYEKNNDHRRIVNVYRVRNGKKIRSNHIWGMTNLQSSSSIDDSISYNVGVSAPKLTILEKLVEFDMLRSIETLQAMGIWVKTTDSRCKQYYLRLLHCAVTQPIPNQSIIQLLVKKSQFKISTSQWNQLLYDTIYYVGAECKRTANYLVKQGARPNLKRKSRTLIHAAVRWNSPHLLHFVMDKLKVPIINTENVPVHKLFEAALDANPSPFYTANGWWDMMFYLVPRLEQLKPYPFDHGLLQTKINIPSEELSSSWFKLMISADVIEKPSDGDLSKIMCQAIREDTASYNHLKELAASTSVSAWPLSENTLSIRRIAVMRQLQRSQAVRISPLETLIYYRGVSDLSSDKQEKYQKLILLLLKREQPFMDTTDGGRILETLCRTIKNENDYRTMAQFLIPSIARTVTFEQVNQVLKDLEPKLQHSQQKLLFSLFERVTQHRIDYYAPSSNMQIVIDANRRLIQRIYEASPSKPKIDIGNSDAMINQCLLPRRVSSFRCLFSWDDINTFSINLNAGDLSRLQISSHLFVRTLWNLEFIHSDRANQIITFVVNLSRQQRGTQLIVGNQQSIVGEILRAGNMQQFRQIYRTRTVVNNLLHSSISTRLQTMPSLKLNSRNIALNIATLIPLLRQLHETIVTCLDTPSSRTDCTKKSTKLVVVFASYLGSNLIIKHIPWMLSSFVTIIDSFRASVVPAIVRENLLFFRHLGMKYGTKAGLAFFTAVDVAVDVYNIVQASNNLIQCQLGSVSCSVRDQVSNAISLSFSGISIIGTGVLLLSGVGAVPIILFNLVRVILEAIAEGIVDVVYYSNTYHTDTGENILIFLRKLIFLPPTARIQRLQRRMDWIESQKKDALHFLNNERNTVAYATGLGYLTDDGIQASWGSIDMSHSSGKYAKGLSRVIPDLNSTYIGLCLPLQNTTESYDSDASYQHTVKTARYQCNNTFVIAKRRRWRRRRAGKLSMVYNLKYINEGHIIGSPTFNNIFLIANGTSMLNLITSGGDVTNTFIMQSAYFCGTINLQDNGNSSNIIDFATVETPYTVSFWWFHSASYGRIQFSHDCFLTINSHISIERNSIIFVHGRINSADSFVCDDTSTANVNRSIIIDGNGGFSRHDADNIKFCKTSILRPFTTIQGSSNPNMTYTTFLTFPEAHISPSKLPEPVELFAQIITHKTKFIVIFSGRPLLASIKKVTYHPIMHDFELKLWYTDTKTLTLLVNHYRSTYAMSFLQNVSDAKKFYEVNTVFIDSYSGLVLYPSIDIADNVTTGITIEKFVALVSVNDSSIEKAFLKYEEIMGSVENKDISLTVKFHAPDGDNNFIFGNNDNDRFVIDKNITLVAGNNGSDVYILTEESSKCVYINNKATDNILDLLIVQEVVCESLYTRSKYTYRLCNASIESDIILICSNSGENPKMTYVVLQRYSTDLNHQHLQIYYRKGLHTLIPNTWIDFSTMTVNSEGRDSSNRLAPFFAFDRDGYNIITLSNRRHYAVISSTDMTNRFTAYKSGRNVLIGKQYLSSSFRLIVLRDFFSNDTNQYSVAEEWTKFKLFLITDVSNDTLPTVLTAGDVLDIFLGSIIEIDTLGEDTNDNLIHEYYVNLNQSERKSEITINHNNATFSNAADCLGVLIVVGAQPKDVTVVWNGIYDTTLEFHIKDVTISVEKWADGVRKRLHRIEFINSIDKPVIIKNLDTITFKPQSSNDFNSFTKHFREEDEYLRELAGKFADAQEQYELRNLIGWDDKVQLIHCVGISYAGYTVFRPIYKLLGFISLVSQMEFMVNDCIPLFSKERLDMLTHIDASETLGKLFRLNKLIDETVDVDYGLLGDFDSLSDNCWNLFKQTLYHYSVANTTDGSPDAAINTDSNPDFFSECLLEV